MQSAGSASGTTTPDVTKIEMVSLPARGDTYGLGETIEFSATFNNPVDADGYVVMGFWMGGRWRGGLYQRGSGTDTLVFAYTVKPEDRDDGIKVHDGYIDQEGRRHGLGGSGDIFIHGVPQTQGVDGIRVNKLYKGIPDQSGHKVDGSQAPRAIKKSLVGSPTDGETYRIGEEIVFELTFSAPVRVLDTIHASLWFDGTREAQRRGVKYVSGSGTDTLRFIYEVQPGDLDSDGLLFGAMDAQNLGEGKIKALDHDVNAIHTYNAWYLDYKVDGRRGVEKLEIISSPGQGEYVEITVFFDTAVVADGEVTLRLGIDYPEDQPRYAAYASGSGTKSPVFKYEVATADWNNDGISIISGDDSLFWGDGIVRAASPDADLDTWHSGLKNIADHRVNGGSLYHDTSAPRIRSVGIISDPGDDGVYAAGEKIVVAITYNEPVSVFGSPLIGLNIGSEVKTARFWDHSMVTKDVDRMGMEPIVLLAYTVQNGDYDADGVSIKADSFDLNGGTIWDKIGNHAKLTHEALPADGLHKVEAPEASKSEDPAIQTANEPVTTDVVLSHHTPELEEGESATYTVALSSQPTGDVKLNITRTPADLGLHAPLALPFLYTWLTPENWNVPQEITVVAEPDDDTDDHLIFLTHTAHGGGYHLETIEMSVVITDNNG